MEYERFGNHYVLRLDPDEEVQAVLLDFVQREDIRGGYFVALGAFSKVRLRYLNVQTNQYEDRELDQQVEVVSCVGNIARENSRPVVHIHVAVSDSRDRTYSGHLGSATVRPMLEVFLTKFDRALLRKKNPKTGLSVLALGQQAGQARAAGGEERQNS